MFLITIIAIITLIIVCSLIASYNKTNQVDEENELELDEQNLQKGKMSKSSLIISLIIVIFISTLIILGIYNIFVKEDNKTYDYTEYTNSDHNYDNDNDNNNNNNNYNNYNYTYNINAGKQERLKKALEADGQIVLTSGEVFDSCVSKAKTYMSYNYSAHFKNSDCVVSTTDFTYYYVTGYSTSGKAFEVLIIHNDEGDYGIVTATY